MKAGRKGEREEGRGRKVKGGRKGGREAEKATWIGCFQHGSQLGPGMEHETQGCALDGESNHLISVHGSML